MVHGVLPFSTDSVYVGEEPEAMAYNKRVVKLLNDLISTCRDAEEGYNKAAKGVGSDFLREKLTDYSRQRAEFAGELQDHVRRLGAEPADEPHGGGILHSGWVDLETRIRPKADKEILIECEKGDETTVKHYEHALAEELPEDVMATVEKQLEAIQDVLDEIRDLEHQPA
jgi:uncharacterized protein (TIGR02284 family)